MESNSKKANNILLENASILEMDGYMLKILQKLSLKKIKAYLMKATTL